MQVRIRTNEIRQILECATVKQRKASRHYRIMRYINIRCGRTAEITTGKRYALTIQQMDMTIKERTTGDYETIVIAFHVNCIAGVIADMIKRTIDNGSVTDVCIIACIVVNHETFLAACEIAGFKEIVAAAVDTTIIAIENLELREPVIFRIASKYSGITIFNVNIGCEHIAICCIPGVRNV